MKKMNNKGFSLVELIIVIAIMAILAGAIAPALIRYIDKSRKSNDVSSAKTIKTAIETALGNEAIYETLTNITTDKTCVIIKVHPGQKSAVADVVAVNEGEKYGVEIINCAGIPEGTDITADEINQEIGTNIGETMPKVKYKKALEPTTISTASATTTTFDPAAFYAVISPRGTVYVFVGASDFDCAMDAETGAISTITKGVMICPDLDKQYQ